MAQCSIEGCERPTHLRGWCSAHYRRWRRHGSANASVRTSPGTLIAWIKAHASTTSDACLDWPFMRNTHGYGHVNVNGRPVLASREMCRVAHGEPPHPKMHAAHSCGRGKQGCVNPNHLSWKTPRDNILDKAEHGTDRRGEANHRTALTEKAVLQIYADTRRHKEIAQEHGCSIGQVSFIKHGVTWSWLTGHAKRQRCRAKHFQEVASV